MRVWTVPVVAMIAVVASFSLSDEPTERSMRVAFEANLTAQVDNVLAFVAEANGPEAVDKLRAAGSDRFEVRSFRKLYCATGEKAGHVCSFAVDIGLRDGGVRQILLGRFVIGERGLAFTYDA
jgi:hypothetical protein